jgi:DNA polymerase I-like protein with 3'-5' exonuclease and polymerase domains
MKTLIVGQIHDSIVADVPWNELDDFLGLAKEVMTERLRKTWKWINIPLEVEAEVAPLGKSWADKVEYQIP